MGSIPPRTPLVIIIIRRKYMRVVGTRRGYDESIIIVVLIIIMIFSFFYSSEHVAPAATIFAIIASASAFERPFFKTHGAPSTKSFASFNPSSVAARTSLMTLIFELVSKASSLRENSVCAASGAWASPPPAPVILP